MANKKIIYGSLIVLGFLYYMNYGRRNMSAKSDNSNDLDNNLTPSLSVDDKISLFKSASNKYSGGAKPTQEILERIKKENEAKEKKYKSRVDRGLVGSRSLFSRAGGRGFYTEGEEV